MLIEKNSSFQNTDSGHFHPQSQSVMMARRGIQGQGRRLPPTPNKPSTLKLQSTNINFPKLNASPTRVS
jgi:voltage-dependent calcium channel N type alpha-1B